MKLKLLTVVEILYFTVLSTDYSSVQTFGNISGITTSERKIDGAIFEQNSFAETDDNKLVTEPSETEPEDVPLWTIPEHIIALCRGDDPEIPEQPNAELNTADSHVTAEKKTVDIESWDDKCLVPSGQYTCSDGQNNKNVLQMEKALTDSHFLLPSVENITLDSFGEDLMTEKRDVKEKEKALTYSHLPVASVENITLDSVGEKVVTEKQDVKDEVKKCVDL